jgi:RHS repeat-associated protein
MLRSGTTSYYQADGLGSLTSLSNPSGALTNTYTYDSFGNLLASTGSLVNSFRCTGREFDTETSLYYYRARYYDPNSGRFVSEDPIRIRGGINLYAYVRNDPVRLTDPDGRCPPEASARSRCSNRTRCPMASTTSSAFVARKGSEIVLFWTKNKKE